MGKVRNKTTKKILKTHIQHRYECVSLANDSGSKRRQYIHKLVAIHFVDNNDPEKYKLIKHIDGNRYNNVHTNLIWTNHMEDDKYANEKWKNNIN